MMPPLREPATDWIGHSYEQRLRLCAQTLYVHRVIEPGIYAALIARIEARTARERMAAAAPEPMEDIAAASIMGCALLALASLAALAALLWASWALWGQ